MGLKKLKDANARLDKFLLEARDKKWRWGDWDCCQFCSKFTEALTGVNVANKYYGDYKKDEDGLLTYGEGDVTSVLRNMEEMLGAKKLKRHELRTGDCVVFKNHNGYPNAGMIQAGKIWFASRVCGVDFLPIKTTIIIAAWRVID